LKSQVLSFLRENYKRARMAARQYRYILRSHLILPKLFLRKLLPHNPKPHNCGHEVIISLTSYKPRFATLHLTLECLLHQTVGPFRLLLWIDEADRALLPEKVLKLRDKGLEIKITPQNHGSYNKLVYTLKENPDAIIVTTDDDTYYQSDLLEKLLSSWSGDQKEIVCGMAFTITVDKNGNKKPFLEWQPIKGASYPRYDVLPFGVGAILYPPRSLAPEVLDHTKYMALCPKADDIWFFWMGRKNGVVYNKISGIDWPVSWPGSQGVALKHDNNAFKNDEQIEKVANVYGWPSLSQR